VAVVLDPRIQALTEALSRAGQSDELVGTSEALRRVEIQLAEVAQTGMTVLILGETGTGKGLAARAVHALSGREAGPFIQVNCGGIPEGLVESELFGHERGAFTGAVSRKLGRVELAQGGTLFLDEVGDLTQDAQGKLLRLLEERTFERVGGTETLRADVRVIAATNRDLKQMVFDGKFREDLYFRLRAFPVRMPPLRERREDIPLLAAYFVELMALHLNKKVPYLAPDALALLNAYDWPGNVRELEHAMQRAAVVCRGAEIRAKDIVLEFGMAGEGSADTVMTLEKLEQRYIREVLERTGWIIKGARGAAALLGVPDSTLRSRMKRLGISRP
jgi:transcriptional regulator with GAF, ATPase, and Fis domain